MIKSQEHHSFIYTVGRAVPAGINLAATAVFTRLASPDQYATYVISYAVAQIGSALFFQWLRQGLLRFSSGDSREQIAGTIAVMYGWQAGLTILLTAAIALTLDIKNPLIVALCGALVLGQAWFDLAQELQRAKLQSARYGLLFFARSVTGLVLGSTALLITGSGLWLTVGVLISFALTPIPFVAKALSGLSFNPALMRRVVRYAWPLTISTSLATASMVGDRLFVAALLDPVQAGLYGPSVDIARQAIFVLVQGVALAGYPMAIRALEAGDTFGAQAQMRKNMELLLLLALPATLGLIAVSSAVSEVMLGAEYREAARILIPISATASLLMCVRMFYFDHAMQLGKRTGYQVVVSVVIVAAFLLCAVTTVERWGIRGAAFSLLTSQALGLMASIVLGRRALKLPFPALTFTKILGSSLCMFFVVLLVSPSKQNSMLSLALSVSAGLLVYAALILITNTIGSRSSLRKRLRNVA